jgi:hypothetical protein
MERPFRNSERRVSQRLDAQLPLYIAGTGFRCATDTKNISSSGLCCQIDRFIPVMTKLELIMVVPVVVKGRKVEKELACSAVVVRIEPEHEQRSGTLYNAGVYFTNIKEKDRVLIAKYIKQIFSASMN